MLDFKEELRKFKPILEIDHIEEAIQSNEVKDILDLLTQITKNIESKPKE
ncbi:MAG: hypothetical protein PWP07_1095 [Epulopiscium sp.]|jgi:hypothetical protein|nr:hypothetical protein [Defluviitalea raffinosedens]MBM7687088.1 hypothetical protein [Defluviitalea raffinosedens]MBZ4667976.1 hypothetical protein [Defluviitaleaceae bacterium]MDK2787870.1 hypothetical protein [Candidatus Epulonipiscium sp.]HHW68234.1 hypothetical protein [Candidatus Epulonipiscium sp.]